MQLKDSSLIHKRFLKDLYHLNNKTATIFIKVSNEHNGYGVWTECALFNSTRLHAFSEDRDQAIVKAEELSKLSAEQITNPDYSPFIESD